MTLSLPRNIVCFGTQLRIGMLVRFQPFGSEPGLAMPQAQAFQTPTCIIQIHKALNQIEAQKIAHSNSRTRLASFRLRVHALNWSYAMESLSFSLMPSATLPQMWLYLFRITRIVLPQDHKHTPRFSTCIAHQVTNSGRNPSKDVIGP